MARTRRVDIWNAVERTRASYYKSSIRRSRKGLKEQLKPIMEFLPDRVDELTSSVVEALVEEQPIKDMMIDIYLLNTFKTDSKDPNRDLFNIIYINTIDLYLFKYRSFNALKAAC